MTEYVIRAGEVVRRDFSETPIQLADTIAEQFTEGVSRKVESLLTYGGNFGTVGMVMIRPNYSHWSVQVLTMPLRCHCNPENGVMVPVFDNKECPLLPMKWTVPEPVMRVVLAVEVVYEPTRKHYFPNEQHLIAFDKQNRMFRLPLSNLFEDLKLCSNMPETRCKTAMDVVRKAVEQFERSEWNDHLYRDASPERRQATKLMFRWKPTDETFQQLPMELPSGKDWTALCTKVAIDKLNSTIIAPQL